MTTLTMQRRTGRGRRRAAGPSGGHAALYDALMWPFERTVLAPWRERLGAGTGGRVLEVGAGTGSQLRWYRPGAAVTALEPNAAMTARARRRAVRAAVPVEVVIGAAEDLPFAAASFDTVVFSFAFCSVADPARALAEARRVLVPGGRLVMLEHVHVSWQPGRRLQTRAAPAWAAVTGGCRLDRDTGRLVGEAGFRILDVRSHVCGWIVEVLAAAPPAGG